MEKIRTDNNSEESGIALVTALIMTVVMLMLIGGMSYILLKGFQTNIINRKFSTVYEAANGGVEFTAGVINTYLANTAVTPANVAITGNLANTLGCSTTTDTAVITARTADGNYSLTSTIQCLGTKPLPGYGGALRFPPPPAMAGGGTGGGATTYIFYSIVSRATETAASSNNIGRTEAIYRVIQ